MRCNFELHAPPTLEDILRQQRGKTMQEWEEAWQQRVPAQFQTELPLPPWHLLRWRRVLF